MLSMLPGTSNSRASRTGLPHWATSSATNVSVASSASLASLASTAERSAGVAPAQPGRARRADATAASTSPGPARANWTTGAPVAGLVTVCVGPPVVTGAPSIQLPATVCEETTVMHPTLSRSVRDGHAAGTYYLSVRYLPRVISWFWLPATTDSVHNHRHG